MLTLVYIEVDLIQVHSHVVMWEFWKKGYMHKMHGTLLLKEFLIKMKVWTLWYNKRSSPKWVNYTYAHLHLRMLSFWSVNFKNFHFSPKWVHIIISSLSIISVVMCYIGLNDRSFVKLPCFGSFLFHVSNINFLSYLQTVIISFFFFFGLPIICKKIYISNIFID